MKDWKFLIIEVADHSQKKWLIKKWDLKFNDGNYDVKMAICRNKDASSQK